MKPLPDPSLAVREAVRNMTPYATARHECTREAEIFLDANENPFGTPGGGAWNRYPDPDASALKTAFSQLLHVGPESIIAGSGSDEIIDLLFRACCDPGREQAAVITPSYGMYDVCARIHNVGTVHLPLDRDFDLDLDRTLDQLARRPHLKLLFLCSPNNPTGNLLSADRVNALAAAFSGITVVDEAYIDFAEDPGMVASLSGQSRLFLLRTFSKAWGMAAVRVGFGIGDPRLIAILNRIKLPYNLGTPAQEAALEVLRHAGERTRMIGTIRGERNRLSTALESFPSIIRVFPSDANFLLVRTRDAGGLHAYLLSRGIVVRNRSSLPGCENCLRISVGTPAENDALLKALREQEDRK